MVSPYLLPVPLETSASETVFRSFQISKLDVYMFYILSRKKFELSNRK